MSLKAGRGDPMIHSLLFSVLLENRAQQREVRTLSVADLLMSDAVQVRSAEMWTSMSTLRTSPPEEGH
uniref:Uncharacterized protein n=1 Tax=Knipowitschia caucasica TaxID=637954 RepID=A0AAV2LGA2_KNICA